MDKFGHSKRIHFDFLQDNVPSAAKYFTPDIYKKGSWYLCILGKDPDTAISGSGPSAREAVWNWNAAFREEAKHR